MDAVRYLSHTCICGAGAAGEIGRVPAPRRQQLIDGAGEGRLLGGLGRGGRAHPAQAARLLLKVAHFGVEQADVGDGQVEAVGGQAAGGRLAARWRPPGLLLTLGGFFAMLRGFLPPRSFSVRLLGLFGLLFFARGMVFVSCHRAIMVARGNLLFLRLLVRSP